MRITNEIATQIVDLGGERHAMTVLLRPSAWEELQAENPPQLNPEATPSAIFGLPIRVTHEAALEVQVLFES